MQDLVIKAIRAAPRVWLGWAVLVSAAWAGEAPAPRLVCDEPDYDFGQVRNTQAVTHAFALRNAGDAPLIVTRVRPTCGCTTVDFIATNLAPGQTATLLARFDLSDRHGVQNKAIYLESNDPLEPRHKLGLKATVVNDVDVLPPIVHFGLLSASSGWVEQHVAVEFTPPPTARVTGVSVDSALFAARLEPTHEIDRYTIAIGTRGGRTNGNVQAFMTITTDHPRYPAIRVPIYVYAQPDLAAFPNALILSAAQPTNAMGVTVYSHSQKPFLIRSIDSPHSNLTVRTARAETNRYQLQIRLPADTKDLDGKELRIRTDLDSMEEVRIPIRVVPAAGPQPGNARVPAAAEPGGIR